jgi:hypothetical protein|tara:strand:+ start:68 stop:499 length:432 start_codon:yes stop_codon:yes gene_type:complete
MTTQPTVRPGRWVYGDHTQFASALDGSVEFSLNISEIPVASRYVLNGWVEGFGTRKKISKNAEFGPYECQYWLKDVLPQSVLDNLTFDSESSEFYCYSKDMESLKIVWEVLADAVVRLNALTKDYHSEMLKVFNITREVSHAG